MTVYIYVIKHWRLGAVQTVLSQLFVRVLGPGTAGLRPLLAFLLFDGNVLVMVCGTEAGAPFLIQ